MTNTGGATNSSESAAMLTGLLPETVEKSSMGKVITCPPPINKESRYWLQEIRKANKAATTRLGAIRRRVTLKKTWTRLALNEMA